MHVYIQMRLNKNTNDQSMQTKKTQEITVLHKNIHWLNLSEFNIQLTAFLKSRDKCLFHDVCFCPLQISILKIFWFSGLTRVCACKGLNFQLKKHKLPKTGHTSNLKLRT